MKPTTLALALAITGVSAWSCSKSSTPAADDKPAASAPAPATASATPAPTPVAASITPAAAPAVPKVVVATPAPVPAEAKPAINTAAPAAPATGPDPRLDVKTALPEAIKELEAKDYASFFKNFIPPSQVAQLPMPPEQMAAMISSVPQAADQFNQMLSALKAIQAVTPTIDPSGNKATFALNPPLGNLKEVSFVKENGMWYLGD